MRLHFIALLVSMVLDITVSERIWANPLEALRYHHSTTSSSEEYTKYKPPDKITSSGEHYKKYKPPDKTTSSDERYKKYKPPDKITSSLSLNLKGNVRRRFAAAAALQHPERNMICSPISALLPLGKLALGASGVSLKQLQEAIGYSKGDIKKSFKELVQSFHNVAGIILNVASMVYVADRVKLKEQYISDVTNTFEAGIQKLDFENRDRAAATINNWVSGQTNGKIQHLISPSQLDASTSLVLVNAVYFRGQWVHPFDYTSEATFYGQRGKKSTITMMHSENHYNYAISDQLQAKIVEIPYKGNSASLVVVLPLERDGLPVLLHKIKLAPEFLEDGLRAMTNRRVSLHIPRFKIETTLDLKRLYEFVGASKIFDKHDSGLSDITQDKSNIYVGEAIQTAVIEVNEHGTEAAAATGDLISVSASMSFYANQPFYFFIYSKKSQIFSGTFYNSENIAGGYHL